MKRFCIINIDGLSPAELRDDAPIDCDVLHGDYRPIVFYTDREDAVRALLKASEKYGPKFHLFESVQRTTIKGAMVKGNSLSVPVMEPIDG